MTDYVKIKVRAYAGYKGEESPRAFLLAGEKIEVVKVMEQWAEERMSTGERLRCFRVKGSDWREHVLCFDEDKKEWYYGKE